MTITQELRGRPVTNQEAQEACRRLINSYFHNKDQARCSIPASPSDDDVLLSDYLGEVGPEAEHAAEMTLELGRARRHGDKFASLHEAYAVILEELDEIWEVTRQKRRDRNGEELRKEFVQLGAMAMKALLSLENFTGGEV
jgi:NTP pyrophosphatase (non-canonical NTP hydrolase)